MLLDLAAMTTPAELGLAPDPTQADWPPTRVPYGYPDVAEYGGPPPQQHPHEPYPYAAPPAQAYAPPPTQHHHHHHHRKYMCDRGWGVASFLRFRAVLDAAYLPRMEFMHSPGSSFKRKSVLTINQRMHSPH